MRKESGKPRTTGLIRGDPANRYTSDEVKKMIECRKEKYGWEFLFLGANIDAVETAAHFGIGADRTVNFHNDTMGIALNYEVVGEAVASVRAHAPLSAGWKSRIDRDYASRESGK